MSDQSFLSIHHHSRHPSFPSRTAGLAPDLLRYWILRWLLLVIFLLWFREADFYVRYMSWHFIDWFDVIRLFALIWCFWATLFYQQLIKRKKKNKTNNYIIQHNETLYISNNVNYQLSTVYTFVGSRPSDHYFRSVCLSVCLFVCLSVCLCRVFFQPFSIRFGSN